MKNKINIGIIQMEIRSDSSDQNLKIENFEKSLKIIEETDGIELFVFPDDFYGGYGYGMLNSPDFAVMGYIDELKEIAIKKQVYIAGSSLFLVPNNTDFKSYSKGFLISKDGELIAEQDRNYLLNREKIWILPGNEIKVFDTELGKIAFVLGFDTLFSNVWQSLLNNQVEIVINPLLYIPIHEGVKENDLPIDFINLKEVYKSSQIYHAYFNSCYILSASGIGNYAHAKQYRCAGGSRVVFPTGKYVELSNDNEDILKLTISNEDLENKKELINFYEKLNMQMG
ncbi:MAG: hypothetical protein A2086_16130 [Spirochaetes bacterium GWD1_27_9]|nr:MAG: hypothetical protein A2Z98_07040 [Spirochaetes bacterium GWB1_27_13]OHD21498.1 MAG: hypothetical protein A2Y34_01470 [Spirochaetes bacterium GWC1_27_15]OHD44180.1 MAG: hypothetical protein A2086_16130 [Spirochaetes bacterium GWD1_27_9]